MQVDTFTFGIKKSGWDGLMDLPEFTTWKMIALLLGWFDGFYVSFEG